METYSGICGKWWAGGSHGNQLKQILISFDLLEEVVYALVG